MLTLLLFTYIFRLNVHKNVLNLQDRKRPWPTIYIQSSSYTVVLISFHEHNYFVY